MKRFIAILLLLPLFSSAQLITKPMLYKSGLMFLSGSLDGTAEVLRINHSHFEQVFPNSNPQFWDAKISAKNKWKNGDPKQGERFFLSSTALCWTTDGYHLMRTGRNLTMITAVAIPLKGKKNWKRYARDALIYYVSYTAGFTLSYNLIYKMP